ncbi:HyaD/HybD family hydrogenase maturation endopeptidase [Sulfuritalea sp.]|uniref:HyaD/HybD family hydrogenase maturation endopeptidase n=1 Tax=Sulfuritalea sp. TaxID=2480090 RepID=UPI00286D9B18|nr:HyaD/HybD family hydrogenase maturation endopeptidase [Sulfuritalea sp.]
MNVMDDLRCEVLVLGIGNLLWADEGFGVRCVEKLSAEWQLPESVTAMDGGTQGLYLLPYVQGARRLIVFDAIDYGLPPGTMKRVEGDEVPRFMGAKKMSLHQTGFQEVIAAAALTGQLPEQLLLIGVQPEELDDYGGSLRPAVKARLDEAVALAVAALRDWGFAPQRRVEKVGAGDTALSMSAYEAGRPSAETASRIGDARYLDA